MPSNPAQRRAAQDGGDHPPPILAGRHQAGDLGDGQFAPAFVLQVGDDVADAEHAHGDDDEVDAVGQLHHAERVALRAGVDVGADQPEQQAQDDHAQRVKDGAVGEDDRGYEAQHHQGEIFCRAEPQGQIGEKGCEEGDQQGADRACEEGRDGGRRQCPPCFALPCHLVSVKGGDHRGGLTWQVDQDGGGRAAVLGAVEDARQHDQRRYRRQAERGRQQHGDGGRGSEAG
jgi:hypothetical protein